MIAQTLERLLARPTMTSGRFQPATYQDQEWLLLTTQKWALASLRPIIKALNQQTIAVQFNAGKNCTL